jgi:iron complex transport system permease protein
VILTLLVLTILTLTSLAIGSRAVAPMTTLRVLVDILTHPGQDAGAADRATALGVSVQDYGAVSYQRLPRTALAESGILGLNAGAAFAVALAVAVFSLTSPASFVWFALAGAFLGTVGVWLIGTGGRSVDPARLTLAGVALGAVLSGITSAIRLSNPKRFSTLLVWESADLSQRGWDLVVPALPFLAAGVLLALALAPGMNALALGDDLATTMGAHITRTRTLMVLAITLLTASATVMAGPITFVGLMAPHAARWMVGPDHRRLLPLAAAIAAGVMLLADVLARVVLWPGEVPVGIVSALLGAPVLIHLVRRRKAFGL